MVSDIVTFKSVRSRSNVHFFLSDIWALWHSGLSESFLMLYFYTLYAIYLCLTFVWNWKTAILRTFVWKIYELMTLLIVNIFCLFVFLLFCFSSFLRLVSLLAVGENEVYIYICVLNFGHFLTVQRLILLFRKPALNYGNFSVVDFLSRPTIFYNCS